MTKESVVIYPYNNYSRGFKSLHKSLGLNKNLRTINRIAARLDQGTLKKIDTLINWGSGSVGPTLTDISTRILNPPSAISLCRDKLKFFDKVSGSVSVPEYTKDPEVALKWVTEGKVVLGRDQTGSCGLDIVFYEDDPEFFLQKSFWVLYKKKKHEFRVHVFNGKVISLQQKAVRTTDFEGKPVQIENVDYRIRNHRNGFIFKRNDINVPDDVVKQALAAVDCIPRLTFGAVDVIYNSFEDKAYVLEINTAPGLEGTTIEDYTKAFKEYLNL